LFGLGTAATLAGGVLIYLDMKPQSSAATSARGSLWPARQKDESQGQVGLMVGCAPERCGIAAAGLF
jgi:hypothetical protein